MNLLNESITNEQVESNVLLSGDYCKVKKGENYKSLSCEKMAVLSSCGISENNGRPNMSESGVNFDYNSFQS